MSYADEDNECPACKGEGGESPQHSVWVNCHLCGGGGTIGFTVKLALEGREAAMRDGWDAAADWVEEQPFSDAALIREANPFTKDGDGG